jgi:hypothetical protein
VSFQPSVAVFTNRKVSAGTVKTLTRGLICLIYILSLFLDLNEIKDVTAAAENVPMIVTVKFRGLNDGTK